METGLIEKLEGMQESFRFFLPESILIAGIIAVIVTGLIKKESHRISSTLTGLLLLLSLTTTIIHWSDYSTPVKLFGAMIRSDDFSAYLKILFDVSGILTVFLSLRNQKNQQHISEYYALILTILLGAHVLVMSMNLVMVFLSLEIISISSYVLAGFTFSKPGAEGSLKYFLFGSVASAVMLYGFSILYGMTNTLDFSSAEFVNHLIGKNSPLLLTAGLMALTGFLYKIAAAPMHPWAPDVYESAPMPVVAFFSVVPKLAGVGILTKFILALNLFGQSGHDWQIIISAITILTLTIGNFSALWQKNPKRMMAYSSIAQSGFLLTGVAAFLPEGVHFMLFYATVYLIMNFLVFFYLDYFDSHHIDTIPSFRGLGKKFIVPSVLLFVGLISLTGLPPTAGFTAKLFVFSSIWEAYSLSGKFILIILIIFGLLNTVISLFYYLRIPYYAFIKSGEEGEKQNNLTPPSPSLSNDSLFGNLLGAILVILLLLLFFWPGLLMGWINKINFVL